MSAVPSTPELLNAVLRTDFLSFLYKVVSTLEFGRSLQHSWHIDAIVYQLARLDTGLIHRLLVTVMPRSLKSIIINVAWPAWLLGQDPSRRIICASYSEELSNKHARDTLRIMTSPWYRRTFPATRLDRRRSGPAEIATTANGFRLATSVGGTLTGRGADTIIIDDPLKAQSAESEHVRNAANEWFQTAVLSRLDDRRSGRIVVVMQRLHEDDLAGYLIERGGWDELSLPAIAEEDEQIPVGTGPDGTVIYHERKAGEVLHAGRDTVESLLATKVQIGSRLFAAQYQQTPVPAEGNLFKAEWIKRYGQPPGREACTAIVQSWDCASKTHESADFSVCTTWYISDHKAYLINVFRERLEFPDLRRAVEQLAAKYQADVVLIEDGGSGQALIQTLAAQSSLRVIARKADTDKVTRASQALVEFEAGRVFLPEDALWLAVFERELLGFPSAKHDDQVDSAVHFLRWFAQRDRYEIGPVTLVSIPKESWGDSFNSGRFFGSSIF